MSSKGQNCSRRLVNAEANGTDGERQIKKGAHNGLHECDSLGLPAGLISAVGRMLASVAQSIMRGSRPEQICMEKPKSRGPQGRLRITMQRHGQDDRTEKT